DRSSGISRIEIVGSKCTQKDSKNNEGGAVAGLPRSNYGAELRRQRLGVGRQWRACRRSAVKRRRRPLVHRGGSLRWRSRLGWCACRLRQSQWPTVGQGELGNGRSVLRSHGAYRHHLRPARSDCVQVAVRNLQFGIVGGSARTAENGAAAIFLVTILMVRHSAGGAENAGWRILIEGHAAIGT